MKIGFDVGGDAVNIYKEIFLRGGVRAPRPSGLLCCSRITFINLRAGRNFNVKGIQKNQR